MATGTTTGTGIYVPAMRSITQELHVSEYNKQDLPKIPLDLQRMTSATAEGDKIKTEGNPSRYYMNEHELRAALEERQREIRKTFHLVQQASKVDLCFMIDCTGSMQPWVDGTKNAVARWTSRLRASYPDCELRFAFVGYTDYDQSEKERIKLIDFTTDYRSFYKFVHGIRIPHHNVGADTAEDVMGGLQAVVTKLSWNATGTKILIHIADAPCHGKQFYNHHSITDRFPEGDPSNISHYEMMEEISKRNIQYWFGYIKKERTDKMIRVLDEALQRLSNRKLMIDQFDASEPSTLEAAVYRSAGTSIARTVDTELEGSTRVRQFQLSPGYPDFDTLPIKVGKKSPPTVERLSGDDVLVDPPSLPVELKCAPHPFAVGGLRLAYHAFEQSDKRQVVLKVFKRTGEKWNSPKRYLEVSEIQKLATSYAKEFNHDKPPGTMEVNFVQVDVVDLEKKEGQEQRWYTMEDYVDGKYEKFNSNTGWVSHQKDLTSITMQAFSHYTWVKSGKMLVVCDLQGVKTDKGMFLTDPAIHSEEYWRYGKTNLGPKGIRHFFKTHKCNDICTRMHLDCYISKHAKKSNKST